MPKIRNIIIFIIIAAVFVLIYLFAIKPASPQSSLVSAIPAASNTNGSTANTDTAAGSTIDTKDFLTLLLNVKNIKLDDAIFSDVAFNSLRDSSIILTPDGTEGRPNPFAQFGNDGASTPPAVVPGSTTVVTPPKN